MRPIDLNPNRSYRGSRLLLFLATVPLLAFLFATGIRADEPLDAGVLAAQILGQVRSKAGPDGLRIAVFPVESHLDKGGLSDSEFQLLEQIAAKKGILSDNRAEVVQRELSKGLVSSPRVSLVNPVRLERAIEKMRFGGDGEAWMADPEQIAALGEAIEANYLAFPALVRSFRDIEWEGSTEQKVPREFKTRTAIEVWLVSVSSGDTVAMAESKQTEHYRPVYSAQIRSVNAASEGFEICLDARANDVYGRTLAVGVMVEDEQGRPLASQDPEFGQRSGALLQIAHHKTVGSVGDFKGKWNNLCLFLPSRVFDMSEKVGPYPATRQFRFKACIWEPAEFKAGGDPALATPDTRWFRIYSTREGAKIVEY